MREEGHGDTAEKREPVHGGVVEIDAATLTALVGAVEFFFHDHPHSKANDHVGFEQVDAEALAEAKRVLGIDA